ncbi:RagB/SusD family nutrient uptake outer membrane protein [Allomuricauda sp. M10]|uniref:RagB/SusD family nutrient uptake outer membrane protein n=1 Tax=Allomuricauda sp. M10 TaxID=2683292 RepID=UPI001D18A4B5|nr:RagB/SusD family nutrient uptake outer membrane protein [Muricauda sp. M10]
MNTRNILTWLPKHIVGLMGMILLTLSCEDYLEVDPPKNQLTGEVVFENAATVDAAFAHIYAELRENGFTTGGTQGLSYLMGHYSDELELYSSSLPAVLNYTNNTVLPSDNSVKNLWDTGYGLVYAANALLEGVSSSGSLTEGEKGRFLGEAYFIRAFIHFHLVNLFGEIPYIMTTDYDENKDVGRLELAMVYQNIEDDLLLAKELLALSATDFERFRPDYWTASALLARVYLYQENWQLAIDEASAILGDSAYALNTDMDRVFLKDSPETLWQLGPGLPGNNTKEAFTFVIVNGPPPNSALTQSLINSFEEGDARLEQWVGSVTDGSETWYFPYKYSEYVPTASTQECSIIFRLVEQYLILAEANAQLGNLGTALEFLNTVRGRATLPFLDNLDQASLLQAVQAERRVEFFSEQGHRFFDLKRTGRADAVLAPIKPGWESTDRLLPIPESELLLNPNLLPQNEGY